ncbi:hypothetical protein KBB68_03165 [Candidatus Babeliales bacterium]|nr:hypothetical protein [Candidatus Babeliales bacterium]
MKTKKSLLLLTISFSFTSIIVGTFPPARQTYEELNEIEPFVVSFGTAMSQTHHSANTANPDWMSEKLQELATKSPNSLKDLQNKDHIGYVLRALPEAICSKCGTKVQPTKLDIINDAKLITSLLADASQQRTAQKLTLTQCPECNGELIEQSRKKVTLTEAHKQAMIAQINHLGVKNQTACTQYNLPTYRISLEISDALMQNSTEIDPSKIQGQAEFIKQMKNPLLFFHHYANPQAIPNLFEKSEHAVWFANCCAEMIKACPNITHVCPISQPVAFSHRVTRGTLPPFTCNISQAQYLDNINQAQVLACQKMKELNPNLKVLMSHQWKPMKPYHSIFSAWYALEKFICYIANQKYNGDFIRIFTPHQDKFDGIALSVYPALRFNGWIPKGNNYADSFDQQDALDAIIQTHATFPKKDIYIVETGCNTNDPEQKKAFIDMTLHVCKIAREKGANIKGVYFWSHTNDPEFYTEWNLLPGATNFGPFDTLNPQDPCSSVNTAGLYLQEIVKP